MSKDNPDRAARLAQALRENLRRRKAQARAAEPRPADADDTPPRVVPVQNEPDQP